jgi:hypothetical protein
LPITTIRKWLQINKLNQILPNLKQIFEGQSTGFDEHVLSSPVQHWIEYTPAVLCIAIEIYKWNFIIYIYTYNKKTYIEKLKKNSSRLTPSLY